ncbi:MAG: hypothetical protein R3F34_14620 [Planctomycetota bacterium]
MKITSLLLAPVVLAATALVGEAQVGEQLPDPGLVDFGGTPATSYADYTGRLVLIEFFAFW